MHNGPVRGTLTTIRLAVSLVYRSGRRQLLLIVGAGVITSVAVAGTLLAGRRILDLIADNDRVDAGELAPSLALLGVLLLVAAVSQAVADELRLPLTEQVSRHTMAEVLDVATEVELEAYEGADFHDRMQRARIAATGQSSAVVFGIVTIISTLIVTTGVVAVLLAVAPVLVPIAVLGIIPIALVNMRNNRARHQLEVEQTELLRNRSYLEYQLTDRSAATEIRLDLARRCAAGSDSGTPGWRSCARSPRPRLTTTDRRDHDRLAATLTDMTTLGRAPIALAPAFPRVCSGGAVADALSRDFAMLSQLATTIPRVRRAASACEARRDGDPAPADAGRSASPRRPERVGTRHRTTVSRWLRLPPTPRRSPRACSCSARDTSAFNWRSARLQAVGSRRGRLRHRRRQGGAAAGGPVARRRCH